MLKTIVLLFVSCLLSPTAFGQCGPLGHMIFNPVAGAAGGYDCTPSPITGVATNGVLYADSTGKINSTATGGVGTLCLTSISGAAPVWGACSGSAATAFSAVTAGTNAAALVMGTGGSLGVSGSGTINATSLGGDASALIARIATPTTLATGTSVSLTAPRQYYICTGTCTVTPPVPAAGYEFCITNTNNVATVITLAALGSSARYENTARTAYGTAGTGTFVSGGAVGDKVCLLGLDSTHYLTVSFNGTWTAN